MEERSAYWGKEETSANTSEGCEGTRSPPPLWKCVSWREVRNGWAALISAKAAASQGQGEQDEREKGRDRGQQRWGVWKEEDHTW